MDKNIEELRQEVEEEKNRKALEKERKRLEYELVPTKNKAWFRLLMLCLFNAIAYWLTTSALRAGIELLHVLIFGIVWATICLCYGFAATPRTSLGAFVFRAWLIISYVYNMFVTVSILFQLR